MIRDYVIVGAGITGATIARVLHDAGKQVVVVEKRPCVGGNAADHVDPSGIVVHDYGPHFFRTSSQAIWDFVCRFAKFYRHEYKIKSYVDGKYENWPVAVSYIRKVCGDDWKPDFLGTPTNFEEAALAMMPRLVYDKFVKGYTEKQWGVPAHTLAPELAKRFDVRFNDDARLKPLHKWQGMPEDGWSKMVERMLDGIPCVLNYDWLKDREEFKARKLLIFTGPLDAYYNHEYGRLAYRSQKREYRWVDWNQVDWISASGYFLPCEHVNYPDPKLSYVRDVEWKHLMESERKSGLVGKSLILRETPYWPEEGDELEYPFPDEEHRMLARRYQERAKEDKSVLICGRLGEYKYLDLDQALARGLLLARRIIGE